MFDRDELGVDPETDVDEETCPVCGQDIDECECEDDEEE